MNRRDRRRMARDAVARMGLRGIDKKRAVTELSKHLAAPEGQAPRFEQPRRRTLRERASGLLVPADAES